MSNRNAILIVGLAAVAGCLPLNRGRTDTWKTVAGKTQPLTLVSTDALLCNVDAITYGKTKTGDSIFCGWYRGDGQVWRGANGAVNPPDTVNDQRVGSKRLAEEPSQPWWWPFGSKKN